MEGKHRQRPPDLALEMEDAVEQIMRDRTQRPMDMLGLAAGMAIIADQRGAAVEAQSMLSASAMPFAMALPGARLESTPDQGSGGDIAGCFDSPAHPARLSPDADKAIGLWQWAASVVAML